MVYGKVFESVQSDRKLERTITAQRESTLTISRAPTPVQEDQVAVPLLPPLDVEHDPLTRRVTVVVRLSLVVNIILLLVKGFVFLSTQSKAVLASLSDSVVDILCQLIIFWADHARNNAHRHYPIGRARLETLGVVLCSVTMSLASAAVIEFAAQELWEGFQGHVDSLDFSFTMALLMAITIGSKALLLAACAALAHVSDVAKTLALDHLNDVLSNLVALVAALLASWHHEELWWTDAAGAIAVSLYIIYSWLGLANEQIGRLVGMGAPDSFVQGIYELGSSFHQQMTVDAIRAYHFGANYLVEVEVVLPPNMTVRESHDIALALQHQIEALDDVERAFVHVDWSTRTEPEHKVDRQLAAKDPETAQQSAGILRTVSTGHSGHSGNSN